MTVLKAALLKVDKDGTSCVVVAPSLVPTGGFSSLGFKVDFEIKQVQFKNFKL